MCSVILSMTLEKFTIYVVEQTASRYTLPEPIINPCFEIGTFFRVNLLQNSNIKVGLTAKSSLRKNFFQTSRSFWITFYFVPFSSVIPFPQKIWVKIYVSCLLSSSKVTHRQINEFIISTRFKECFFKKLKTFFKWTKVYWNHRTLHQLVHMKL